MRKYKCSREHLLQLFLDYLRSMDLVLGNMPFGSIRSFSGLLPDI